MVSTVWVNANHGRDFADYMTKLRNFTKEENRDFLAIIVLLQALTNLIVYLMISQKIHKEVAQTN